MLAQAYVLAQRASLLAAAQLPANETIAEAARLADVRPSVSAECLVSYYFTLFAPCGLPQDAFDLLQHGPGACLAQVLCLFFSAWLAVHRAAWTAWGNQPSAPAAARPLTPAESATLADALLGSPFRAGAEAGTADNPMGRRATSSTRPMSYGGNFATPSVASLSDRLKSIETNRIEFAAERYADLLRSAGLSEVEIALAFILVGGCVDHMVDRALCMREAPGSIPGTSKFFKLASMFHPLHASILLSPSPVGLCALQCPCIA